MKKQGLKTLFVVLLISLLNSGQLRAQTFEEFQQQIEKEYADFEKETQQQFDQFVAKIDAEFADFLAASFRSFEATAGKPKKPGPKPEKPPKFTEKEQGQTAMQPQKPPQKKPSTRLPNIQKSEPEDFKGAPLTFDFYGAPIKLTYDPRLQNTTLTAVSADGISEWWTAISESYYNHLIRQLQEFKTDLNLNDFAYAQLVKATAQAIHPDNTNQQALMEWFLLTRSRFLAKIAFNNEQLFVLQPALQTRYGENFVLIDNRPYYLPPGTPDNINTYAGQFPEADIIPDLTIRRPLNLPFEKGVKNVSFKHADKNYSFEVVYNKNLLKFYNSLPLTDASVYFNSAIDLRTKESLTLALKPYIQKLPQAEAAALLLSFVQNAFEYQTDQEQFGKEKFLFPDELFHYAASDCEDRSVLFAWLTRNLLDMKVVGLAFDGHMATAVCIEGLEGAGFEHEGCRYVVADPTFIGAPIGLVMPLVKNQTPDLVLVDAVSEQEMQIRELLLKAGLYRADRLNDLIFDKAGNAYACGYFVSEFNYGDEKISASSGNKNTVLISLDKDHKLRWIKHFEGTNDNMAYDLHLENDNLLSVAGTFKDEMKLGKGSLTASPGADIFILRMTTDGQMKWATQAGLDKLNQNSNFMFAAAFDMKGSKISARLYSESENFDHYGLQASPEGNLYLTGSFFASSGMNMKSEKRFDSGAGFDPAENLKSENDALLQENYEKTIAGLFAATKLLQINTIELKGQKVKEVFDRYNPAFAQFAPGFYNSFGGMSFMKNAGGIISIRTTDGKDITFDRIKISDNARIKVVAYKSGNASVEIFSGIELSNGQLSYPLNQVKLYKDTGDLLLDFDTDHSQIKINLKADLLQK
ncbi:MAG: hypothetical protein KJ578_11610 [Bacteroidetes bacterium]|nr:hypothetical protein [Bacteroidota bacterium]MBU1579248.1 hypothetical protein [Bacteroidota bacterium]MBU2558416.1 hypothetical protein [Bacteroidota bacterium]